MNHNQKEICPNCGGTGENPNRFDQLKAAHGSNFALAPATLVCEDCGGSGEVPSKEFTLVWQLDGDTAKRRRFFGFFNDRPQAESAIHRYHFSEMVKGDAADCTFDEMDKTINPNFWEIKEGNPVSVSRAVEGITLNGDEYLLDAENNLMIFGSITEAQNFLKENGCADEELEAFNFHFTHRQTGMIPVFSLVCASGDQLHASNGIIGEIEQSDYVAGLNDTDRKTVLEFLEKAEIGETLTCAGIIILRLKEDENVACDCCS
jgi:hypothetical protein